MTQLGHCVLANKILGPVLSGRFISTETRIGIPFFEVLVRPFPLEHKKLMFMFMILILLVGTKLYQTEDGFPCSTRHFTRLMTRKDASECPSR